MSYLNNTGVSHLWEKIGEKHGQGLNLNTSNDNWIITLLNKNGSAIGGTITLSPATTGKGGYMSATDKSKLESVEKGANNYVLPVATTTTLGGVIVGDNLTISDKEISVPKGSTEKAGVLRLGTRAGTAAEGDHTHTKSQISDLPALAAVATSGSYNDLTNKPSAYTLPTASSSTLGGIKVGTNLSIDSSGNLSAKDTTYSAATTSAAGLMSTTDKAKLNSLGKALTIMDAGGNTIASYDGTGNVTGTITSTIYESTSNITYADITDALSAGKTIVLECTYQYSNGDYAYLHLHLITETPSDSYYIFVGIDDRYYMHTWTIDSSNNYAETHQSLFQSPTFTGTVTLPAISGTTLNDNTAATTAFVQAVVNASGAGVVHYKGAATSIDNLVNYTTGDYWVASATFTLGTETIESGDMIFANKTATAYTAANFDVVQANITAMTDTEIDQACGLA